MNNDCQKYAHLPATSYAHIQYANILPKACTRSNYDSAAHSINC